MSRSITEWELAENWNYALCAGDRVIGSAGLMSRAGPRALEIGYWVHTAYAGRGLASAAANALADTGLRIPGVERILIKQDVANPASGRVAARAGFLEVEKVETEIRAPGQTGLEQVWERRR